MIPYQTIVNPIDKHFALEARISVSCKKSIVLRGFYFE